MENENAVYGKCIQRFVDKFRKNAYTRYEKIK